MLRIALIGDPHFMVDNAAIMREFIECTIAWIDRENPDIIVCLGDILHQHERIHITPFLLAQDFLEKCRVRKPTKLLIGNHDRPNNSHYLTTDHPFNACKEWKNLTIVDQGCVEEINGFKIAMIPYVPRGRFREAYDSIVGDQKIDLVLAHQEFKGCKMGAIPSKDGDPWSQDNPFCVSGHIHLRHELKDANVYYVGTPLQHDHSEIEDKGVHILTMTRITNEDEISKKSKIPLEEETAGGSEDEKEEEKKEEKGKEVKFDLHFEELPLPRKITITIRADEFETVEIPYGQVKLIVRGEPAEITVIKRSTRYKKLLKKCKIHFLPTIVKNETPLKPGLSYLDLVNEDLKESERKYLRQLLEGELEEIV